MFKGWTLIEWLAAIAIIAILVCLLVPPSWFPDRRKRIPPPETDDSVPIILPCGAVGHMPVTRGDP
jgi:prepilin-type N-terminal cleavage/methylation domain-containing protein